MNAIELKAGNLFADLPGATVDEEEVMTLLDAAGMQLLRIVTPGQATPDGGWYDQNEDEWVVLLQGRAGLIIEGETVARQLEPGDWVLLPAHFRHRVQWTDPNGPTVWLALHYKR